MTATATLPSPDLLLSRLRPLTDRQREKKPGAG